MITAGRIAGTLALVIIVGWIFWLTGRVQTLLNLAETLVDRDHGPALPPDTPHVAPPTRYRNLGDRPTPTVRHQPPPPVTVYTVTDQPTDPGTVPMTVPADTDEIPVVRPIPPKTQPAAAVLVAHWSAGVDDFEQRQERMLDEARTAIRQIAEGVA